jgi:DNA-binding SARP family transcriptional activator/predicted ATPase
VPSSAGLGELRLHLFGLPDIRLDGQPIILRRRSALALLAYLAATGRPHRREALATLLADEVGDDQASRLLCNAVYELRGAIGDHLLATPTEVGLQPGRPRWLDVATFRTSLSTALATGDLHGIRVALDVPQDEFLAGVTLREAPQFEAWLLQQREELLVLTVRGLQAVIDYHARYGLPDEGIVAARRLLALEPWREEVHRQLMVLLARAGQRSAALKQFQRCQQVLAQELATAPEAATVALAARLRAGPRAVPHNLPPPPLPFVGREAELGQLGQRLHDPACRLISLVGLGGSGKTCLALESVRRYADPTGALDAHPFQDGVFLVPLASAPSDGTVPTGVASASASAEDAARRVLRAIAGVVGVGLDAAGDPLPPLASALRDRALLLILDGMEQLVDGAPVLWQLVRQAPRLKLVVTSRVRLRLLGEWELEVGGLSVPDGPADLEWAGASVLFLQQARRAQPGLFQDAQDTLGAAHREAIVRICRLAGGLPLPLVLAAAWTPVRSCAELAAELAAAGDVPEAPVRGLPVRQRRLRDILDAAWDALSAPEQAVLRWLPLFRGGFTREAARAVVGASPQHLLTLLDHLLVSPGPGERYALNEVVARYAIQQQAGRMEERACLVARHAAYFAEYVQARAAALHRSRQAVADLEAERANVLAAWEWAAAEGHIDLLARLRPGVLLFQQRSAPAAPTAVASTAPVATAPVATAPVAGESAPVPWSGQPPNGAGVEDQVRELALAAA